MKKERAINRALDPNRQAPAARVQIGKPYKKEGRGTRLLLSYQEITLFEREIFGADCTRSGRKLSTRRTYHEQPEYYPSLVYLSE